MLVAAVSMVAGLIVLAGPASATTPTGFSSSGVTFTAGTADSQTVHAVPNNAANSVNCEDVFFPVVDCFGHIFSNDDGITYASGVGPNSNQWEVFTDGSTPVGTYDTTLQACDSSAHCITETYTVTVVAAPSLVVNPSPMIFHAGSATTESASITSSVPDGSPVTITCPNCGTNLPAGLHFTSFGDANPGTATIAGKAAAADSGPFTVKLKAVSDEGGVTTQNVTGYVYQTTTFSSNSLTLLYGTTNNLPATVTTSGYPAAVDVTESGTLPTGVSFTNNGNGSGTFSGTPTQSGVFSVTLTADNHVTTPVSETYTITVNRKPSINNGGATWICVAPGCGYAIGTVTGYPLPSVSISGAPSSFYLSTTSTGVDTETLYLHNSGCTGCGGSYPISITATNSVGTKTINDTLIVEETPTLDGPYSADWTALHSNSWTISTSGGYPTPAVLSVSYLPGWATFTDNGNGTATVTGTPPVSASGDNWIYVTACNNNSTQCTSAWYDIFVQAPNAPMPTHAPTSDGLISGVNIITQPGSTVNWSGSGFAPYAPVTFAIYNAQTYKGQQIIATVDADANGNVTYNGTVPNVTGIKYVVAGGYKKNGTVQYLTGQTRFMY